MVDAEASVDENDDGATIAAVTTENASEVTVDDDRFEVADGNLKLKDGSSLDFEADTSPIEVTLTAVSDGDDDTATVSISINDVNEDPSIDVRDGEEVPGHPGVISSLSVDENAMRGDDGPPPLALIEVMDPDAADADMLTGDAGMAATSVSDDRFAVIQDPENGLWLHLAEGASLNYEDASEVMVTVTYTDSAGNTASQDVTVMVNDVNEAPMAVGEVPTVTAQSGRAIDVEVDLTALFNDPDAGDAGSLRWELSGNPSWLGLQVEYVTDDSGNEKVIGHLRGTPPTRGPESNAAHMVTLTATDRGGESGSVTFYAVVDEANDRITGINLLDNNGNAVNDVDVDENDASGVVLGEITIDDADHPMHPNGMHLVTVDDDRFEIREDDEGGLWLALKEGVSLNHEKRGELGVIEIEITAVDMNGEQNSLLDRAFGAPRYKGFSDTATFTVLVNDLNDAPKAGTVGNWWITVNEDEEADNVDAGDLLSVDLEEQRDNDSFPAFRDDDISAGDSLTYSISGAPWIQINPRSGKITNVEEMIPNRGIHRVTVTATDEAGESASVSFTVNVAHSDEESPTDDSLTGENDDPRANDASGRYYENSGERVVATFSVSDGDQDIPDHLFAIRTVQIIRVQNANARSVDDQGNAISGGTPDPLNATDLIDHDNDPNTPNQAGIASPDTSASTIAIAVANQGYAAAFRLSEPRKSGDIWYYDVLVRDTDPRQGARNDATGLLNRESVEDIEITVRVTDGTGESADAEISVIIENVNEEPAVVNASPTNPTGNMTAANRTVNQSEANKIVLFIKLEEFWNDPDERDNNDDLIFGASTSASWIDIKHGPAEWRDIEDNLETGQGWNSFGTGYENRLVGSAGDPADGEKVVIVEIDRTESGSRAHGDRGSFTLTARDDEGAEGSVTARVTVTDQNLDIVSTSGNPAVTISGSAREGSTLRARFNENNDPDLRGAESPVLVLYEWHTGSVDTSGVFTSSAVIQRGTSDTLSLAQRHVGSHIQVQVTYYEVVGQGSGATFTSQFITTGDTDGQLGRIDGGSVVTTNVAVQAHTERAVTNSPDDGVGHFSITIGSDVLTAVVSIQDEDYTGRAVTPSLGANTNIVFSWQVSANGVGGWRDVDQDGDADTSTLELDDGEGRYYRAVATYDADGVDDDADPSDGDDDVMESVYSDPIQVANVADAADSTATPPTTDQTPAARSLTGSPNPGGTLSVSGSGFASVQWQADSPAPGTVWTNIPGATGDLNVTSALAGSTVRALVTYETSVPGQSGVTAVVIAVDGNDLDGDTDTAENGILIGGSTTPARPTAVDDHTVTGSVMGSGHTARGPNGPITGVGNTSGHTVSITETVDLASLFQDPDSARLSFSAAGDAASNNTGADLTGGSTSGGSYLFQGETGVLVLNVRSGELTYVSDQLRGHDGDQTDGAGNRLTLNITANDSPTGTVTARDSIGTSDVSVRINVAPTGINFTAGTDNADLSDHAILTGYVDSTGTAVTNTNDAIAGITVEELVEATGREVLAVIDVQDENWAGTTTPARIPGHPFGVHEVTVTGDDRFVITKSGGASALRDRDNNGSTWELRLKKGATFDHESDDTDELTDGTQIKLTFMATDGGGLSTPVATGATTAGGNGFIPITLIITVADNAADNRAIPLPTDTPGLKDDETSDADDTKDDDSTDNTEHDDETDGGAPPPPPGMSLGGIIEDFIDNMDGYEQDLLEDFLLTIDDGLDIA